MYKTIAFANLVIGIQSLLLFFHFFFKRKGLKANNKLISLILFSFTLITFNTFFVLNQFPLNYLYQEIANNSLWFIGPSLFLYLKNWKKPEKLESYFFHFIPFLVVSVFDIITDYSIYNSIIPIIAYSQMSVYLICSLILILKYKEALYRIYSIFIIYTFLVISNLFLWLGFELDIIQKSPIYLTLTTIMMIPIYYLSYKEMNSDQSFDLSKYETTKISKEKAESYIQKITECVEIEKLYKIPALTLNDISQRTSIPIRYISQLINHYLKLSFTDYITQLRVNEAKVNLLSDQYKNYTIAGIAEESGFISVSNFNFLFKKHTGMTPSQYKKVAKS